MYWKLACQVQKKVYLKLPFKYKPQYAEHELKGCCDIAKWKSDLFTLLSLATLGALFVGLL
jgi:hypothetical protein